MANCTPPTLAEELMSTSIVNDAPAATVCGDGLKNRVLVGGGWAAAGACAATTATAVFVAATPTAAVGVPAGSSLALGVDLTVGTGTACAFGTLVPVALLASWGELDSSVQFMCDATVTR